MNQVSEVDFAEIQATQLEVAIHKCKQVRLMPPVPSNTRKPPLSHATARPIAQHPHKHRQAQALCSGPVIVEDTSLVLNSLGGMPGVYIKDFWESMGNVGLMRMLDAFEDRSCYVQCTLCFARDSESAVKTFVGQTFGSITRKERGDKNFAWDPIFQPINTDKTFGEMTLAEKNSFSHRAKAFKQLEVYLNTRMGS